MLTDTNFCHCLNFCDILVFRKKYPIDGSDEEMIVADAINPAGIAIDMESDNLYWLSHGINTLFRNDLDRSSRTALVTNLRYPTGIALDTVNK